MSEEVTVHRPAPVRKETTSERYWRHQVYRNRYDAKKPCVVIKQEGDGRRMFK